MVEPPPKPIKNKGPYERAIIEDAKKIKEPKVAGMDLNYRVFLSG